MLTLSPSNRESLPNRLPGVYLGQFNETGRRGSTNTRRKANYPDRISTPPCTMQLSSDIRRSSLLCNSVGSMP